VGNADAGPAASAAVVTGAARGLGQAIAVQLAEGGQQVVGVDLSGPELDAAMAALPGSGHCAIAGDVTDEHVLTRALDAVTAGAGLRTFVANAGLARPGDSLGYPMESWDLLLDVMLRSSFLGAREACRRMPRGGSIVMISSICGQFGFAGRAAYCAAKAGVQGLVRALAVEWAPRAVRVNAIAPGTIATELQANFMKTGYASAEGYLRHIPMGRFGAPADVADAVGFLCSERAAYITGAVLPVDGGWACLGMSDVS
jgi:NAD(P)-dependent dehydrogenase (short-subunit alcohol dehydrogenase family)